LRSAIQAISWPKQPATTGVAFEPFVICPHTTLTGSRRDSAAIFIDAPDITIECGYGGYGEGCVVDRGGTHFSFGSHAVNVLVRSITFRGARTTSQVLYYDSAEVVYEDCIWEENAALARNGAVVDINSISTVSFYRCDVAEAKQMPRVRAGLGAGFGSSISIRK